MTLKRRPVLLGVLGFSFVGICGLVALFRIGQPKQQLSTPASKPGSEVRLPAEVPKATRRTPAGDSAQAKKALTAQTAEGLAQEYCAKYARAVEESKYQDSTFMADKYLFLREARLLAKAFPEAIERAATPIALDTKANPLEREYAILMLSYVGNSPVPGNVPATLRSLLQDPEGAVSDSALAAISSPDKDGQFKSLYWDACRRGSLTGFYLASQWLDSGTIGEMKSLLARQPDNYIAQNVLKKMDLLASPRWEEMIEPMLADPLHPERSDFSWAVSVSRMRGSKIHVDALRKRLDQGFSEARKQWEGQRSDLGLSFNEAFKTSAEISRTTNDPKYDDALIATLLANGPLSDLEKARLRTFGYGCDPKQRLEELLFSER